MGEGAVFGELVIMYLFLGGCGAGMLLVASLWSLLFHRGADRTRRESDVFRTFRNRCFVAGTVVAAVGAACLLADLGKPERFLLLFFRPNQTYLTFGTFVLAAMVALGAFLSMGNCLYVPWIRSKAKQVAEVLCAIFAVAVMAYTGLFLRALEAVAFWDTWWTPVLFVMSAVSMGISACLIIGSSLRDAWVIGRYALTAHRVHLGVLLLEALALGAFMVAAATGRGQAPESLSLMLADPLVWWFAFGVVACGLVLPFAGDALALLRRGAPAFPLADVLCLFGGFALRFCIVSAGLH